LIEGEKAPITYKTKEGKKRERKAAAVQGWGGKRGRHLRLAQEKKEGVRRGRFCDGLLEEEKKGQGMDPCRHREAKGRRQ